MAVSDYELVMIIKPSADDDAMAAVVDRTKKFVADHGGEVLREEQWGLRRLAYPIQSFREGAYYMTQFRMDGGATSELDAMIRLQEDVIRYLLVLVEQKAEEPAKQKTG